MVGRSWTWGETVRLTAILLRDTSSQVCAALSEWQFAATRGELVLADLYDATANAHFKKPRPYPRPWDKPPKTFGSRVDDVASVLAAHRAAIDALRATRAGTDTTTSGGVAGG